MGFIFMSLEPEPERFINNTGGVKVVNGLEDNTGDRPS